jgi:hypothetical protein
MTWAAGWKSDGSDLFDVVHEGYADRFKAYDYLADTIEYLREEDWKEFPDEPVEEWWKDVEQSLESLKGLCREWSATSGGKHPVTLWAEERRHGS